MRARTEILWILSFLIFPFILNYAQTTHRPSTSKNVKINSAVLLPKPECEISSSIGFPQKATNNSVFGRVVDLKSIQPLESVVILLLDSLKNVRAIEKSGKDGIFLFDKIKFDKIYIKTYRLGYVSTFTGPFNLSAHDTLRMIIKLEAVPIPLDEVIVTAHNRVPKLERVKYYWRKENLTGHFITAQDFLDRGINSTFVIFRGVPGLLVRGDRIFFTQYMTASLSQTNPSPLIYVDEILMNIDDEGIFGDPISWVVPEDILGIEVYNVANAPMRY